jgi:hypothetical protein
MQAPSCLQMESLEASLLWLRCLAARADTPAQPPGGEPAGSPSHAAGDAGHSGHLGGGQQHERQAASGVKRKMLQGGQARQPALTCPPEQQCFFAAVIVCA